VGDGSIHGWLHQARRSVGVLMIPAIGFEATNTYRAWRDLGCRFAGLGMPTLRLTLPGTGDAPEADERPDLIERWLDAILVAHDWMRGQPGMSEVIGCGLHVGALLAICAARRQPSAMRRMILLAPPLSGAVFLRQSRVRARVTQFPVSALRGDRVELPGLRLHPTAAQALGDLSLAGAVPGKAILLLGEPASPGPGSGLQASSGSSIEECAFPARNLVLGHHLNATWPEAEWSDIRLWLQRDTASPPQLLKSPMTVTGADVVVPGSTWTERHVTILSRRATRLAGCLAAPDSTASAPAAVVVLGTALNSHSGYARTGANLCRRLAAAGIPALRFDGEGVGESDGDALSSHAEMYSARQVVTTRDVIAWMGARGHERVVLVGICSGAFQAMRACLADSRVAGAVLVNQVLFGRWNGGGIAGWKWRRDFLTSHARQRMALLAPSGGDGTVGVDLPAPGGMRASFRRRVGRAVLWADGKAQSWIRRADLDLPMRQLRRLKRERKSIVMITTRSDTSWEAMQQHFGRAFERLIDSDLAELVMAEEFDHPFSVAAAQDALFEATMRCIEKVKSG